MHYRNFKVYQGHITGTETRTVTVTNQSGYSWTRTTPNYTYYTTIDLSSLGGSNYSVLSFSCSRSGATYTLKDSNLRVSFFSSSTVFISELMRITISYEIQYAVDIDRYDSYSSIRSGSPQASHSSDKLKRFYVKSNIKQYPSDILDGDSDEYIDIWTGTYGSTGFYVYCSNYTDYTIHFDLNLVNGINTGTFRFKTSGNIYGEDAHRDFQSLEQAGKLEHQFYLDPNEEEIQVLWFDVDEVLEEVNINFLIRDDDTDTVLGGYGIDWEA